MNGIVVWPLNPHYLGPGPVEYVRFGMLSGLRGSGLRSGCGAFGAFQG